jgi:hypothetical protein
MSNFSTARFLKEREGVVFSKFAVDNIDFDLMSLSKKLKKEIISTAKDYEEAVNMAADMGLSFDSKRAFDIEGMTEHLSALWGDDEMDVDCDPCVRQRVGEEICSISGLDDHLETLLAIIDGDNITASQEDVTMEELELDAAAALNC